MPSFGRLYAPDDRDRDFSMSKVLDPLRDKYFPKGLPEGSRNYRPGPLLDQGQTGTCVAHGTTLRITSSPVMQPLPQHLTPYNLYRQIVLVDEWKSNDFEATAPDSKLQSGTSVRAGLKTGQKLGCFPNYLWAQSVEDVRAWHLAGFGGVVIGIDWKANMMETDSEGFINYTGALEGGHCVASIGWSDKKMHNGKVVRAMRFQNSWGKGWGDKGTGRAWISADDLAKAFADKGDFGAPTEIRVK
jgi:hypothetical protein